MRILLMPSSYPPVLGGLQTVAHNLAKGLAGNGHSVRVITNRYPRSMPTCETMDDVPVRRLLFLSPDIRYLKKGRPGLFMASFLFFVTTCLQLARIMREFGPDVVNIHYPLGQIPFALWLRKRFTFRLVVSLHGDELLEPIRGKSDSAGLRAVLQQADAVTACSDWLLQQAVAFEPAVRSKGVAIHNGVDPNRFKDNNSHAHCKAYILAFGRLSYQKGFDLLLHAFARVSRRYPDVDLILAGDGEELERLQALSASAPGGRVHFFGRATPEEVVRLLNGCLFLVVPSRWEPFGIVALEGLAAGRPVLATRVGGLVELAAASGCDLHLVDPTVAGLREGLERLLQEQEGGKQEHRACSSVLEIFSWLRAVEKYEEVLAG